MESRESAPNVLIVAQSPELLDTCRSVCSHLHWSEQSIPATALAHTDSGNHCDLIIAEAELPGFEVGSLLRAMRMQFPQVPIVVFSASEAVQGGPSLLEAGATSVLSSDSSPQTLIEVLRNALNVETARTSGLFEGRPFCELSLSLDTSTALQQRIPLLLADILEQRGYLDKSQRRRLDLAFQEALTNALEHGNLELSSAWREETDSAGVDKYSAVKSLRLADPHFASRKVVISFEFRDDIYSIRLRDEGPGFTPPPKDLLSALATSEKCSGRGLAIIASSVDEFHYSNSGREVILRKRLGPSAAQPTGV